VLFVFPTIIKPTTHTPKITKNSLSDLGKSRVQAIAAGLPPAAWTGRKSAYPRDCGVHEVFLEIAARMPEHPAIRTESCEVNYGELDRRANRLANYLIAQGVSIGARVGLLLDRSPELIIAQLAILKAGGVYVPIDSGAPPERVDFFVRDAGLLLLICMGDATTVPSPPGLRILRLDCESTAIDQASASNPGRSNKGGDPAYVMYTSGSTGSPKGVEIPHRGIIRLVFFQDYFPAGPDQCTLLLGSPGFDGTTYEIWSALLHGACCAVFPDRWIDHARLEHVIRSLGVTCLWISTGLFNQIIDHRPRLLETARHVLVGGEALSVPHIRRAMEAMPHVQFGNGYGPTECTTFGCAWVIDTPSTWGCESVPLGFPLNNTECHILDANLRPVPVGVVGELLLGGDGLALRYLNRPDLTAERFIRHPFSGVPGARLYRTGDRCYWLPNGMIAYVGRDDDQVKLRGYRIELGEVGNALCHCHGIENAAVIVHEFPSGARGLVGCIVSESGHVWDERATLAELALQLPEAMLPSRLVRVDTLPLTPNGKVDRRGLAAIVAAGFAAEKSEPFPPEVPSPALAETTSQLLAIWKRVLRDASVDAASDFFRCGGDSLLAVELTMGIARLLGREIPAGTVYRFSTPRQFAQWLQDSATQGGRLPAVEAVGMVGEGPGTPVFFVPGREGYGIIPKPMAHALAGRHPYFDRLTFPTVSDECDPGTSVEGIASGLLAQVRRVRPHGPYVFVGFSFGGLVAFELARQLTEAGETVEHVVLWDAYPLLDLERRSALAAGAELIRLAFSPDRWRDRIWLRSKLPGLRRRLFAVRERVLGLFTNDPARKAKPVSSAVPTAEAFHPLPYTGRVSLLACMEEAENWVFERYVVDRDAWAKVVPSDCLTVIHFPCGHLDILRAPHLDSFVAKTLDIIGSSSGN
jgi:amino acid adenylation domain-containing protein